ncbi:hypothetical protein LBMAG53_15790 [Planctomycetota bacterium]|nr:hypothetical protein LBMAG53_15790 [Planctomycetota bacterium]
MISSVAGLVLAALIGADPIPIGQGIAVEVGVRLVLTGRFVLSQGPPDGLELLATTRNGRLHEALVELDADDAVAIQVAAVAALGIGAGRPPDSLTGRPPVGTPVQVHLNWDDDLGRRHDHPGAELIRDRTTDRHLPPWPWVWSGSLFGTWPDPSKPGQSRRMLAAALDGMILAIFDENNSSLAALPIPDPRQDDRWEVNSALAPPVGTLVQVTVSACTFSVGGAPGEWAVGDGSRKIAVAKLAPPPLANVTTAVQLPTIWITEPPVVHPAD